MKFHTILKRSIISLCIIILLFVVALPGGGWYFSDILRKKALDPDRPAPEKDSKVIACAGETITLEKILFYDDDFKSKGIYGIEWENGFGIISDLISGDDTRATRKFRLIKGSLPARGTETIIDFNVFPREPYQVEGLAAKEISYTSALGTFLAYFEDNREKTWIIMVHGNGMILIDNRRAALSFKKLGYPTLNISFRNDKNQPEDSSGLMLFGLTEWRDLEGAVQYALDKGASDIVLFGISMGGGIVLNFMYKSPLKSEVKGLILDSPTLNFSKTVDLSAEKERLPLVGLPLPQVLTDAAKFIAQVRFKINWEEINYLKNADKLSVPILLFHSSGDRTIPPATSDELAEKRKDLIFRYIRIDEVDHIKSWNYDPESYEKHLSDFMEFCRTKQ